MPNCQSWKPVCLALAAGITLASLACSPVESLPSASTTWRIDSTPLVAIGVYQGDSAYELDQANSAVRLPDGRIIVANSGSEQLRYFDSTGRALGSVGREGQGPGEFEGVLGVYPVAHDSLVIFSSENRRYSVADNDGRYSHTLAIEASAATPFPWDDWLQSSTWVRGVRDQSLRPCVARVLTGLPVPPDSMPIRRALVDDLHSVWVQPALSAEQSGQWVVHALDGSSTASVSLPTGLELLQAGQDFVLGRRQGNDGAEQIAVYRLHGRAAEPPAKCDAIAMPAADTVSTASAAHAKAQVEEMKSDLRNFIVAQEMYYAGHGGYAIEADSTGWTSPGGSKIWLMRADRAGWFGFMTSPGAAAPLCAAGVGGVVPPGWESGTPRCQQRGP